MLILISVFAILLIIAIALTAVVGTGALAIILTFGDVILFIIIVVKIIKHIIRKHKGS